MAAVERAPFPLRLVATRGPNIPRGAHAHIVEPYMVPRSLPLSCLKAPCSKYNLPYFKSQHFGTLMQFT